MPTCSLDFHGLPWSSVASNVGALSPTFTSGLSSAAGDRRVASRHTPTAMATSAIRFHIFMRFLLVLEGYEANGCPRVRGALPMREGNQEGVQLRRGRSETATPEQW